MRDGKEPVGKAYVDCVRAFAKDSLDFVLVDGGYRDSCMSVIPEYIRPGGLLILDNANWYLPSNTQSPCSRAKEQGPISPAWNCKTG